MEVAVAVFDVDKTLTVRDCVIPFTRRIAGTARLFIGALSQSPALLPALVRRNRNEVKAIFTQIAFRDREIEAVETEGIVFADHVYNSWMRSDVAKRFRWHQQQGHVVVLVSASFDAYLVPLGELLEADAVLCTQLERHGAQFTGRIDGANCRGEEKVRRITQWCSESGVSLSAITYAYGDSAGDREMLALAQHGCDVSIGEIEEVATC